MAQNPDMRIIIGADIPETKSVIKEDLKTVAKQINQEQTTTNVKVGLDVEATKKIFEEKLRIVTKDLKVEGIKLDLKTDVNTDKITEKIKEVTNDINKMSSNIPKDISIKLPEIKIEQAVNSKNLENKVKQLALQSVQYQDYSIGKASNTKISGSDDRLISLQLYNDELKKAVNLKYQYSSDNQTVNLISEQEITNTKQLADLQEKIFKQQEKIRNQQYKTFSKFDTNVLSLETSYTSGSKKIVDTDKLDILNKAKENIVAEITKVQNNAQNGIVPEKDLINIQKLIDEYKILIKVQKDAQYSATKLATDTFDNGKNKTLNNVQIEVDKQKKLGKITKENSNEVNQLIKAIKNADDSVSLKNATTQWDIFLKKLNNAEKTIKNFPSVKDIPTDKLYVSDRTKTNPIENIQNKLLSQNGVESVSTSSKTYFDGQKEQLQSFITTVQYANGEVKNLKFELANIGKSKGFVQADNNSYKSKVSKITEDAKQLKQQFVDLNNNDFVIQTNNLEKDISRLGQSGQVLREELSDLNKLYIQLKQAQENAQNTIKPNGENLTAQDLIDNKDVENVQKFNALLDEYFNKLNLLKQKTDIAKPISVIGDKEAKQQRDLNQFILSLKEFEKINGRMVNNKGIHNAFNDLLADTDRLKNLDFSQWNDADLNILKARLAEIGVELDKVGLKGQTFAQKLKLQVEKLGVYVSGAAIVMGGIRQLKQMITTVTELDSAVTNLSVATGYNREETKKLLSTYSALGKELGSTTVEVANAADDWLRTGKSIEATNKLIKDSVMLSKLGKIDTSEATKALSTMQKSYELTDEDMTSIVDKFTAVDAVSATTAGGIAKSFQETAVSARLLGVDINRMTGYIARVSEVSGDSDESVGNFFKTFFARMANIKEGRLIDPDTSEDLSTVETVLKNMGIYLRDDNGQFRNFQNVLDEIAIKWKELEQSGDNVGQTKIASALGLTRQAEKVKILFEGYDKALEYADVATNSLGTAEQKFQTAYLNSVESHMDSFKAQYEALSSAIINSDLIKGTFDVGTGILGFLTNVIEKLGSIPTLIATASGALAGFSNKGMFNLVDKEFDKYGNETLSGKGFGLNLFGLFDNKDNSDLKIFEQLSQDVLKYGETSKEVIAKTFNLSEANKKLANSFMYSNKSTKDISQEFLNTSKSLNKMTISSKLAAGAMQVLSVAGNMLLMSAIAWGIQKAITYQSELRETAIETSQAYKEETTSIDNYKTKIKDLSTQLENSNISEKDAYNIRSELITIQDELNKKYGAEVQGLDLVNGKYEEQLGLLDKVSAKKANELLNTNSTAYNRANKEINKERTYDLMKIPSLSWDTLTKNQDFNKLIKEFNLEVEKNIGGAGNEYQVLKITADATQAEKTINDFLIKIKNLPKDNSITPELLDEFAYYGEQALKDNQKILDKYQDNYNSYINATIGATAEYSNLNNEMVKAREEYNEAVAKDDNNAIANSLSKMQNIKDTLLAMNFDDGTKGVQDYFNNFFKEFEAYSVQNRFKIDLNKLIIPPDANQLRETMKTAADTWNKITNGNVDYNNRPVKTYDEMITADSSYNIGKGNFATTYTMGYSYFDDKNSEIPIVLTPILDNGKVLNAESLDDYFDKLVKDAKSSVDILNKDKIENGGLGLIVHIATSNDDMKEIEHRLINWKDKHLNAWTKLNHYTIKDEIQNILSNFDGLDDKQILNIGNIEGTKQQEEAFDELIGVADKYGVTVQDLINWLVELNMVQGEFSNSVNENPITFPTLEEANKNLDSLQTAFQTLSKATQEYNQKGYLTIDNMQAIIGLGNDYIKYLTIENGQVRLNTQGLKELALARIDDAEAAYLEESTNLISSLTNETSASEYLSNAKNKEANARLNAAEAKYQEAMANAMLEGKSYIVNRALKLLQDTVAKGRKVYDIARQSVGQYTAAVMGVGDAAKDAAKKIQDSQNSIKTLLSTVMSMIKQQYADEKKDLQERLDNIKKLEKEDKKAADEYLENNKKKIEAQLDLLKAEKERHDYESKLEDKSKKVSNIQSELDKLAFDDSAEATKKKKELAEKLAEAQKDLDEHQYDNSIKLQEDSLNQEKERIERIHKAKIESIESEYNIKIENLEKQIKAIEDYVSIEGNIRTEAIALIEGKSSELYQKLLDWNKKYGTGIDEDIRQQWLKCYKALDTYNQGQYNVLATLELLTRKMAELTDKAEGMANTATGAIQGINDAIKEANDSIEEFKYNGTLKEDDFEYFDKGKYPSGNKNHTLVSNTNDIKFKLPKRHTGGFATANISNEAKKLFALANNESVYKLTTDELVLTSTQQQRLMEQLNINDKLNTDNIEYNNNIPNIRMGDIIVQGNADNDTVMKMQKLQKQTVDMVFDRINKQK